MIYIIYLLWPEYQPTKMCESVNCVKIQIKKSEARGASRIDESGGWYPPVRDKRFILFPVR